MATTATVTTYQIQQRVFTTDAASVITITGLDVATTVKVNVYFIKTGKIIPPPVAGVVPIILETYLPESSYASWVDLLRNEKPLTMVVNGTSFYVQTGQEPVGAHEIGA
jgi:hypothetical protein